MAQSGIPTDRLESTSRAIYGPTTERLYSNLHTHSRSQMILSSEHKVRYGRCGVERVLCTDHQAELRAFRTGGYLEVTRSMRMVDLLMYGS